MAGSPLPIALLPVEYIFAIVRRVTMRSSGYNLALQHVFAQHDGGPRFIPIIVTNRQTEAGRRIELGLGSEAIGYTQWNLQGSAPLLETKAVFSELSAGSIASRID